MRKKAPLEMAAAALALVAGGIWFAASHGLIGLAAYLIALVFGAAVSIGLDRSRYYGGKR